MKTKKRKLNKKNTRKKAKKGFNYGNIDTSRLRLLFVILAIVFVETAILVPKYILKFGQDESTMVAYAPIQAKNELEEDIRLMVQGYPIEEMTPYIATKDKKVAAFMIAIAKKESAWGKRKPVLNGQDCYNYWGFRLKTDRMGSGGHTCFNSPQEAVETVAQRIDQLVTEEKIDTPKEMVIWKCGYRCDGPEAVGANKWIKDVDYYYRALIN